MAIERRERVVWILGAGFSKALGGPLLPDLLSTPSAYRVVHAFMDAFKDDFRHAQLVASLCESGTSKSRHCFEPQWEHAEEFLERLDIAVAPGGDVEANNLITYINRWTAELENRGGEWAKLSQSVMDAEEHHDDGAIHAIRAMALKLLSAECSSFLLSAHENHERWMPYIRWAGNLKADDTALTFNYDCVPELLSKWANPLWIPDPFTLAGLRLGEHDDSVAVLKLHGSLSWRRNSSDAYCTIDREENFLDCAVKCPTAQLAIAVPGHSKRQAVSGPLAAIWDKATDRLAEADQLVFIGGRRGDVSAIVRFVFSIGRGGHGDPRGQSARQRRLADVVMNKSQNGRNVPALSVGP